MRFYSLDVIRGLAAIAVVCFHIVPFMPVYVAVDLFFILSGFVLAHRYFDNDEGGSFGSFVIARIARLYPLHLFTLLVTLGIYWAFDIFRQYPDGQLNTFIQQLLLIHNLGFHTHWLTWNEPSWSISVEFWVNLIVFAYVARKASTLTLLFCAMAGYLLILRTIGHLDVHVHMVLQFINAGLLKCFAGICLGIVCYRAHKSSLSFFQQRSILTTVLEVLLLAGAIALMFYAPIRTKTDFLAPIIFFGLVFVYSFDQGLLAWLFRKSALGFLGTISYSVYLNQWWVFELGRALDLDMHSLTIEAFATTWAILLPASIATYYLVEQPGRRIFSRTAKTLKRLAST